MAKRILTEKRRKYLKLSVSRRRRKLKVMAVEYMGGKCVMCGYNKCVNALHFHHLDPSKKEFTISSGNTIKFETIKTELEKCILICANCHAETHFKEKESEILEQEEYLKKVVRPSIYVKCFNCGKDKKIFNSYLRKKNFCTRQCKILYFYNEGWPTDADFLNMCEALNISDVSTKIGKSKTSVYDRLKKLKSGNNEPQVVYKTKIDWPTDEELAKWVWEKPRTTIAEELGVSDKAVIKRCQARNINMPGRGYWTKIKSGKL
jgi:hypothetical protein